MVTRSVDQSSVGLDHTPVIFIDKTKSAMAAVVMERKWVATVNPPTQSPYKTAYRERCQLVWKPS